MLSTPTASTKKGITSTMMRVALIPNHEQKPNDDATDNKTMKTPTIPTVIFASTYNHKSIKIGARCRWLKTGYNEYIFLIYFKPFFHSDLLNFCFDQIS